jgi:anti-sigma factor RsiW
MHQVIREHLEAILDGTLTGAPAQQVDSHLAGCTECRQLVGSFRSQHELFTALRVNDSLEPAPGFYARVMQQVEAEKPSHDSMWFPFLETAFGWRLALASAVLVVLIGGFMVSSEPSEQAAFAQSDEVIYDGVAPVVGESNIAPATRDRETVLVNLATYKGQ